MKPVNPHEGTLGFCAYSLVQTDDGRFCRIVALLAATRLSQLNRGYNSSIMAGTCLFRAPARGIGIPNGSQRTHQTTVLLRVGTKKSLIIVSKKRAIRISVHVPAIGYGFVAHLTCPCTQHRCAKKSLYTYQQGFVGF